jgi:hypothetical protein
LEAQATPADRPKASNKEAKKSSSNILARSSFFDHP